MDKKKTILAMFVLSILAVSLHTYWRIGRKQLKFNPIVGPTLIISNVSWNVSLARAEFNLTVPGGEFYPTIAIRHVEVNGTKADSHPENPSIGHGESVKVAVYFSYEYNKTYSFNFLDEDGRNFPFDLTIAS